MLGMLLREKLRNTEITRKTKVREIVAEIEKRKTDERRGILKLRQRGTSKKMYWRHKRRGSEK